MYTDNCSLFVSQTMQLCLHISQPLLQILVGGCTTATKATNLRWTLRARQTTNWISLLSTGLDALEPVSE